MDCLLQPGLSYSEYGTVTTWGACFPDSQPEKYLFNFPNFSLRNNLALEDASQHNAMSVFGGGGDGIVECSAAAFPLWIFSSS